MKNLVFGINSICEVLKIRPHDIFHIVISKDREIQKCIDILKMAKAHNIPITYKNDSEWTKFLRQFGNFNHMSHQHVAAEVKSQKEVSLEDVLDSIKSRVGDPRSEKGFLLVLDDIIDPQNLGSLIRGAACANVHGVIIPKCGAAQLTPAVHKVSAGGTEHVPVLRVSNISYTLDRLQEEGFTTIGLASEGSISLFDIDLTSSLALVIGNEERGLNRLVRGKCDYIAKIPMPGALDSLNASQAGVISLFEVIRQRKKK